VKYGGDPPHVRASVELSGDSVLYRVRDNGDGIAEADRHNVFDRFYKGTGVKGKGLGIGLFVSKEIVERLGGSLTFETGPDGTEFRMVTPLETGMSAALSNGSTETTSPAAPSGALRK
jgi:signal transduction histidine kinase